MEKRQVLYIHGGNGFTKYGDYIAYLKTLDLDPFAEAHTRWNKTLAEDLGEDFEVFMPGMPNKLNAKYQEWKIWFEKHFEYLRDDVILVGFSLGSMFLTKYLSEQKPPVRIKALILLAPAAYYFVDPETGEDGGDFNCVSDNVPAIQNKVEQIYIFHSKDDFVIPYDHAEKLKELLPKAELITFEDKNHFLVEELPELVKKIKELA